MWSRRASENILFLLFGFALAAALDFVQRFHLNVQSIHTIVDDNTAHYIADIAQIINGTALSFLTIALVVATARLVRAEHEQAKITKRSADNTELQLRASVTVVSADVQLQKSGIHVNVRITNTGETPAHGMMIFHTFEIREQGEYDDPSTDVQSRFDHGAREFGSLDAGTPLDISNTFGETGRLQKVVLIFWGRIDYRDVFAEIAGRPNRQQNFRFLVNPGDLTLQRTAGGNASH
jgi:hypothetical protein